MTSQDCHSGTQDQLREHVIGVPERHATEAIDGSCKKCGAMVLYKEAREWW